MSVILATQEVEIRRIVVPGQPRQKVLETPVSTNVWARWCTPVIVNYVRKHK
jgi:hypothetical protein